VKLLCITNGISTVRTAPANVLV